MSNPKAWKDKRAEYLENARDIGSQYYRENRCLAIEELVAEVGRLRRIVAVYYSRIDAYEDQQSAGDLITCEAAVIAVEEAAQ